MKQIILALYVFPGLFTLVLNAQPNYYVSPAGNNNNAGTSPASPWQTVQYALDHVSPGAIINLREGVFNEKVHWTTSGTVGQPIVLKSYPGETAILSGAGLVNQPAIIFIENKSHIRLENLVLEENYMDYARGIHISGEGTNITIEKCTIRNIGFTNDPSVNPYSVNPNGQAHGLLVNGRTSVGYRDIFIRENELHNLVTGNSEALTLVGNTYDFEVTNNLLYDNTNIGIDAAGHFSWAVDGGVPESLNQARNGIIARNKVYNHRRFSNVDAPAGIYVDGGKDILVEHNLSFRNGNGLSVGCENAGKTAQNIIVRNNFVFDNDNNGIVFGANMGDIVNCQYRNNTSVKNGKLTNWTIEVFLQKSTNSLVANNILLARSNMHHAIGLFGYTVSNLNITHNLVFREGGNTDYLIVGDPVFPAHSNTLTSDPMLVSSALPSPDLHLQVGSPAINTGNNAYVTSNEQDIDAGARTANSTVDRGADEAGSQGCVPDLVLRGIIPSGFYQADSQLSAFNGEVEGSAMVVINAPDILLGAGFEVKLGGLFSTNNDCSILP